MAVAATGWTVTGCVGPRFQIQRLIPGTAASILFGNLFYAWQAHRLAKREGLNEATLLREALDDILRKYNS